ncbi:MAG TPA: hypothetical protein VFG46_29985 [Chryseolinea sp.]|nr:hypothetical protein [Chryseolinea sp.]
MKLKLFTTPKQFVAYASMILLTLLLFACSNDDDGGPKASSIEITSMTPASPATLKYYETASINDHVRIVYNYSVIEPNGVRIWIKAASTTDSNYNSFYSPSKIYKGTGTNSVIVSVKSEDESVVVDKLMLIIYDPQSQVRSQDSVAVNYTFSK